MNAERNRAVDDLTESEYRSLDLIEHIPIGLYRTTPDGRVLMANRALLKMLGCASFAEATAQDLEQDNNSLYPRPLFKERLERDGAIRGLEVAWRRRDGTTVFVREHARAVRAADGRVLYYEGTVEDITERKQAEEQLRASEQRLAEAQVVAHLGSWEWDVVSGHLTWSAEHYRLFGLCPEEFDTIYESAVRCIHPDDREFVAEIINQARRDHKPFKVNHRIIRPDGTICIVQGRGKVITDDAGRVVMMIGTVQDITEYKRTEEALLRTQARLRLINNISTAIRAGMSVAEIIASAVTQTQQYFSSFRVAYSTIDEHNRLTVIHSVEPPTLPALTNLTFDLTAAPAYLRALRRSEVIVVADVMRDERLAPLADALRAGDTHAMLDVPVRHSAELVGLFCCDAPAPHTWTEHEIETIKEIAAYLSVVIREAHAEQERMRAEAARGELLAQLVTAQEEERRRIALELHDQLGQYVTALMLGLKALQDSGELAGANERLQQLLRLADQLGEEAHRLAWELRPSALDDLGLQGTLRNYLEEWALRFGRAVDFHSSGLRARLPAQIESALYRIIQEALTNVAKHAQARHVSVILEWRQGRVLAIVEDDGRGFDTVEVLERAHTARRMGLVGMHERARLIGGELEIESAPGEGTTIYVRVLLTE